MHVFSRRSIVGMLVGAAVVLTLGGAGCDCGGGTLEPPPGDRDGGNTDGAVMPPITGLTSLEIAPLDATLRIEGGVAATQAYTATGTFMDGRSEDVSTRVTWRIAALGPRLGTFARNVFTTGTAFGGRTKVEALAGGVSANTNVTVQLVTAVPIPPTGGAPALPADPGSMFGGTVDASRAPELVYPNDEVVLPPNLGRVEIHWLRGPAENTLFEVAFTSAFSDVRAYVRCERPAGIRGDGCIWEPSGAVWTYIAESNRGGEAIEVTVRATADDGGAVGESGVIHVRFAKDDLNGTVYYWTTSEGSRVMRYDFGAAAGAAERVMGPENTESGNCVGCHALSRDGRKILGTVGGQNNGGMLLVDLETGTALRNDTLGDDHILQFGTFSPDGNELAGVYGDETGRVTFDMLLFDTRCDAGSMATCGQQTGTIALGGAEASHPDWSPDGMRIAYTDVGVHGTSQRPRHGAISYVEREGTAWSAPRVLVARADGLNRYNPSHAPDGTFVIYNESTCPGGDVNDAACDADSDEPSKVWAVVSGGGTPVRLARATERGAEDTTDDTQATFPRLAPFTFTLSDGDLGPTRVMYLTYASRRAYGLRSPATASDDARATWLWMAAVTPEQVVAGADGSFPAFALPFQQLDTSNHIAVWTTESIGDPIIF